MRTIILPIILLVVQAAEKATIYGNYCGLGHYDRHGAIPIDELDRICQIHDI
jgi:hypothetical protein